jgi:hypothetical protein
VYTDLASLAVCFGTCSYSPCRAESLATLRTPKEMAAEEGGEGVRIYSSGEDAQLLEDYRIASELQEEERRVQAVRTAEARRVEVVRSQASEIVRGEKGTNIPTAHPLPQQGGGAPPPPPPAAYSYGTWNDPRYAAREPVVVYRNNDAQVFLIFTCLILWCIFLVPLIFIIIYYEEYDDDDIYGR